MIELCPNFKVATNALATLGFDANNFCPIGIVVDRKIPPALLCHLGDWTSEVIHFLGGHIPNVNLAKLKGDFFKEVALVFPKAECEGKPYYLIHGEYQSHEVLHSSRQGSDAYVCVFYLADKDNFSKVFDMVIKNLHLAVNSMMDSYSGMH